MKINLVFTPCCLLLSSSIAVAELVSNGSFELNKFEINYESRPDTQLNGTAGCLNWEAGPGVGPITIGLVTGDLYRNGPYYNSPDGLYFAGLFGPHGDWIRQTIPTTPGVQYRLSFKESHGGVYQNGSGWIFLSSVGGLQCTITGASILHEALFSPDGPVIHNNSTGPVPNGIAGRWEEKTLLFVADSYATSVQFTAVGDGVVFLDQVSVVPEPSILAFAGVATISFALRRRLHKRP